VRKDLKNSLNGYLKSLCTVYEDRTYDEAVSACSKLDMKLFVANSTEEKDSLGKFSDTQWPYGSFWVDGKAGTNCSVFSNDKKVNYTKTEMVCLTRSCFHCEYQSEIQKRFLKQT
jgi:hypothetical protein